LAANIKYPAIDREKKITGKVYVTFVIEKDGTLSNVRAVRGPSETTMAEAARAIALSPKWNPGIQRGIPVRVNYTVPVNFTLTDGSSSSAPLYFTSSDSLQYKQDGSMILKGNPKIRLGNGANPPLIVINGKESTREVNSINPNDIIAVNVLRGESATKKYGDKGKYGVIEVETKVKQ
jgi:TonB family protein